MQVMDQIPSLRWSPGPMQRPHILTFSVAEARRVPQIDGLRAMAILMVFGSHAFGIPLFWMGVDLFFVLSGFLITGILLRLKENRAAGGSYWSAFYARRVRRILPPYVAFLVVVTLLFRVHWGQSWYWYAFFTPNIPLALGKVTVAALGPLWSLGVEEQFYFAWPWLVLSCGKLALRRAALCLIVITPFLRAIFTPLFSTHFPIYCLTVFRADALAVGAFIAVVTSCDSQWIGRRRNASLAGFLIAAALLACLSGLPNFRAAANTAFFNSIGYSLSAVCWGSALVYVLGLQKGLLHTFLTAPPVRYLGLVSYTFYLYHAAVLSKVGQYFHSRALMISAAFSVTLLISVLSWHLLEVPILGRSAKKLTNDVLKLGASRPTWRAAGAGSADSQIVVASPHLYQRRWN